MNLKSKYKLSYTLNKEQKDLVLDVELTMNEGLLKPGQNVWSGHATLNGQEYLKYDLSHCVNAKLAAEKIGHELRDELKASIRKEGKSFKVKKEELV